MSKGRVISIHIASAAGTPIEALDSAQAIARQGIDGDRYFSRTGFWSATPGAVRDMTLIESEAVEAMNTKLGATIAAGDLRRNVVTRGVALNHLVGREFRVGEVQLRGTGLCQPCTHLEALTRIGVKAAMQHRCGLRAEILTTGTIRIGDAIVALDDLLERNKEIIRRYYQEMWNSWNFAKTEEILARDIVFRGSLGTETKGREAFCEYMRQVLGAFPDFHNTIEEIVSENDGVVARLTYRGTHRGEILGVAPTGKTIEYAGAAFFRIANGKVSQGWVLGDVLSLLRQLGAQKLP
jgi:steroid delta-isomerase-like uncharacterized protein